MKGLKVGALRSQGAIKTLIGDQVERLESLGVKMHVEESLYGNFFVFRCDTRRPWELMSKEAIRLLKESLAGGLTDIIIEDYERLLVHRLVDENYSYLASFDRDLVKTSILMRLQGCGDKTEKDPVLTDKSQRKSRIWAKLTEFLEAEDEIIIEGFITFRLKSYLDELYDLVEKTAEDHLVDREYAEFVGLLRHFMDRQKTKCTVINVVRKKDGFSILDENLLPIQGDVGEFLRFPPKGMGLDEDDLIVSAVVTLSPRKIIWHGLKGPSPCFDLLKNLMGDGFSLCPGCRLGEDGK